MAADHRRSVQWALLALVALLLAGGAWLGVSMARERRLTSAVSASATMLATLFDMDQLVSDYAAAPGPRAIEQWTLRSAALGRLLEDLPTDASVAATVEGVRAAHAAARTLFAGATASDANAAQIGAASEQLRLHSRLMVLAAQRLHQQSLARSQRLGEIALIVTGGIIAALFAGVLTVAALYVRSTRALLRQSLALERTNAELARSVADLDQFASIASHDLQEPLRGITMYLDLLEVRQGSRLTEVGLGYVRQAVTSANRMGDLITALLTYARATGRREPEPVDAAAAAREAIGNLRARIEEMRAEIEIGELPWVSASHVQLVGVFQNLIGNGIKFCDGQPRVQVAADRVGDDWEFSVRDNGIGISPEAASRLFRLFQRLEPTRFAGTGIGLITCKRIIEEFGGRIWLTSTPGAGSTFRFTLKGAQAPG